MKFRNEEFEDVIILEAVNSFELQKRIKDYAMNHIIIDCQYSAQHLSEEECKPGCSKCGFYSALIFSR
jgi:hypothetical protein